VTDDEDMANLFLAIQSLRARAWFPKSVRDIRAFRALGASRVGASKTKDILEDCRRRLGKW